MHFSGALMSASVPPLRCDVGGVTECWGEEMGRWAVFCDSSRGPVYRWIDNIPQTQFSVSCYRYHHAQFSLSSLLHFTKLG